MPTSGPQVSFPIRKKERCGLVTGKNAFRLESPATSNLHFFPYPIPADISPYRDALLNPLFDSASAHLAQHNGSSGRCPDTVLS